MDVIDECEVFRNEHFEEIRLLGKTDFSIVKLMRWIEADKLVAVKILTGVLDLERFYHEVSALSLGSSHDNLLFFYGIYIGQNGEVGIVIEIADGMKFLHTLRPTMVVHRDLKPSNILIKENGRVVKIADFGMARIRDFDDPASFHTVCGTYRYCAPEVVTEKSYTCACDVYSFGVIMWALVNSRKPFEHMNEYEVLQRVIRGGEKLPLEGMRDDLRELISRCTDRDASRRPNFDEILDNLENIRA